MSSYNTRVNPKKTNRKLDSDLQEPELRTLLESQWAKEKLERQAYLRHQKSIAKQSRILQTPATQQLPHSVTQPSTFATQPSAQWYLTVNQRTVQPYCPTWGDRACSECHASLLSSERDKWCCVGGKYSLPRLRPYPPAFEHFLKDNNRQIQLYARTLNNLFSFSAIGYTGTQHSYGNLPQNVVITGRVYHRMLNLDADHGSLKWFLFDDQDHQHHENGAHWNVPGHFIDACKQLLNGCSPYLQVLRHAISTTGPADFHIHLDRPSATGDIAAIVNPYNMHEVHGRKIVVSPQSGGPSDFVNILSAEYEPLQYPLLFPYGEAGWSRDANQGPQNLTQAWWYRSRLLCEERFNIWGRLTCEYIVDMYSQLEEEHLEYI